MGNSWVDRVEWTGVPNLLRMVYRYAEQVCTDVPVPAATAD